MNLYFDSLKINSLNPLKKKKKFFNEFNEINKKKGGEEIKI